MYMYTETNTRVFIPAAVCMILYFVVFKYNIIARRLYIIVYEFVCDGGGGLKITFSNGFFENVNMHTAASLTSIPMQLYRRRITSSLWLKMS